MDEKTDVDLDTNTIVGDDDPTRPDIPSPPDSPRDPTKPEEYVDVLWRP